MEYQGVGIVFSSLYRALKPWKKLFSPWAASITVSRFWKTYSRIKLTETGVSPMFSGFVAVSLFSEAAFFSGFHGFCLCLINFLEDIQDIVSAFYFNRRGVLGNGCNIASKGVNLEKRVSSSSGSSTLEIIKIILSADTGIASIMRGVLSASKPNSELACYIISRKRVFALSLP